MIGQPYCDKVQCLGYDKESRRPEMFMQQYASARQTLKDGKPMPKHLMVLLEGAPDAADVHCKAQVVPEGSRVRPSYR